MKVYHGYRRQWPSSTSGEPTTRDCVVTVTDGERRYELPLRLDIANKSPTGFEWGYGGSGPAQLALALVADACGDEYADPPIFQRVKEWVVAPLPNDGWMLTQEQITEAVQRAIREAHWTRRLTDDEMEELAMREAGLLDRPDSPEPKGGDA